MSLLQDMSASTAARQIFARYSLWKTPLWSVCVALYSGWILSLGFANGWQPPPESTHAGIYLLGYGAAPICFGIAAALIANLVISRGVAIARIGDEIVLYFPFGWKRISLRGHMTVLSTVYTQEAPVAYSSSWFKVPPVQAPQVTFARAGLPDINFATGLLTEKADVIAPRIAEAIKARPA